MMRTRTPRLLVALAATSLVLAGCGSGDGDADRPPTADDTSTADAAMVAPRPIQVAAGGAGVATAEAGAEPAADRASDAMLAPYQVTTFVAGEGLPALPANDTGFVFQAGATAVSGEQVAAMAAALGVPGEPRRIDEGYGVRWEVGANDGTTPALYVYEDALGSWYYSGAWAEVEARASGCAVAGSAGVAEPAIEPAPDEVAPATIPVGDADVTSAVTSAVMPDVVCEEAEPPTGILTAEAAEARTRELMTALGLDPAQFTFEPYADEWYASVSAVELMAEGVTARRFDAGFGAEGVLQSAGGQLAVPVPAGPYPLIDLDTAIARLNDQSGFWGYYGGGIAVDTAVARETGVAVAEAPVSDVAVADAPVSSPEQPPAEPEQVTVTLVDVQADVWWAWDVDGSVWVLPAYRFIGEDGGWYTVPAVTDEFLVQAPVPEPEPMPVETVVVDTVVIDSVPPETVAPPAEEPFDTTALEPFVGSSVIEFTKQAETLGATVRVARQNGEDLALTMDYIPTRVNVAVDGDGDAAVVTEILNVG